MEFEQVIRSRYSVRAYQSRPIPEDVLNRIVDAFILAPTAANRQAFGLIIIPTVGREQDLRRIYGAEWFAAQAPIVVAVCTEPAKCWVRRDGKNYADVDAAIAFEHLILAATDEGLGTCWVGAFDPTAAREVLGLPDGIEPVAFTPVGYPASIAGPRLRKKRDQLVHPGRW